MCMDAVIVSGRLFADLPSAIVDINLKCIIYCNSYFARARHPSRFRIKQIELPWGGMNIKWKLDKEDCYLYTAIYRINKLYCLWAIPVGFYNYLQLIGEFHSSDCDFLFNAYSAKYFTMLFLLELVGQVILVDNRHNYIAQSITGSFPWLALIIYCNPSHHFTFCLPTDRIAIERANKIITK